MSHFGLKDVESLLASACFFASVHIYVPKLTTPAALYHCVVTQLHALTCMPKIKSFNDKVKAKLKRKHVCASIASINYSIIYSEQNLHSLEHCKRNRINCLLLELKVLFNLNSRSKFYCNFDKNKQFGVLWCSGLERNVMNSI